MKHKRKTRRGRKAAASALLDNALGAPTASVAGKPFRYRKPPPTELELNARRINETVAYIGTTRRRIKQIEQDLSNERETLSNLMLEHQQATAKASELSRIPQPTG